jgi:hypothetical protein
MQEGLDALGIAGSVAVTFIVRDVPAVGVYEAELPEGIDHLKVRVISLANPSKQSTSTVPLPISVPVLYLTPPLLKAESSHADAGFLLPLKAVTPATVPENDVA